MKIFHAVFEDGVFKPTEEVDLPEHSRVKVEPEEEDGDGVRKTRAEARIREILSREFDTGDPNASERVDDIQT